MIVYPNFNRKEVIENCLGQDECCFFLHIRQESTCGKYVLYVFQKEGKLYTHVIDVEKQKLVLYNTCIRHVSEHIQLLNDALVSIEEDGIDVDDEDDVCGTVYVRIREKNLGTCYFSGNEITTNVYDIVYESPYLPHSYVLRGSEVQEKVFDKCYHGKNDSYNMTKMPHSVLERLTNKAIEIEKHVNSGGSINLEHWKAVYIQGAKYL